MLTRRVEAGARHAQLSGDTSCDRHRFRCHRTRRCAEGRPATLGTSDTGPPPASSGARRRVRPLGGDVRGVTQRAPHCVQRCAPGRVSAAVCAAPRGGGRTSVSEVWGAWRWWVGRAPWKLSNDLNQRDATTQTDLNNTEQDGESQSERVRRCAALFTRKRHADQTQSRSAPAHATGSGQRTPQGCPLAGGGGEGLSARQSAYRR